MGFRGFMCIFKTQPTAAPERKKSSGQVVGALSGYWPVKICQFQLVSVYRLSAMGKYDFHYRI